MTAPVRWRPADRAHRGRTAATRTAGPGRAVDARRWWALAAIGLSLLTVSVDATILNTALPTLSAELNASTSDLQWFVDAFTLAMATLLLPAGLIGDSYGRKKMLLGALAVFGGSSAWCAYSGSPGVLIAARTVLGASAAFLVPLCTSVLLDLFSGERDRAKAVGVIAVSQTLGLPLGPIAGGVLLKHFWGGSVFLVNLPLVGMGLAAVAVLVPESRGTRRGSIDLLGVLISSLGLLGIVYGSIKAGEASWGSAKALGPLIGGAALLVLFALWEIRVTAAGEPLVDLSLFRHRGFVWGSLLGTVVSFAMFGLIFALPQYFQAVDDTDTLGTGLRLLPLIGGALASAAVVNRLASGAASRFVPAAGFALVAVGLFIGTRTSVSSGYGFVSVWLVVIGLGLGLAMTSTMAAAVNPLPAERGGVGSALVSALRQVGGSVGVAVLGTIANSHYRSSLHLARLPGHVVELVRRSVTTGTEVGKKLGNPALVGSVQDAFMHAMRTLLGVCGAIAVVAALLAVAFMSQRAAPDANGRKTTTDSKDNTVKEPQNIAQFRREIESLFGELRAARKNVAQSAQEPEPVPADPEPAAEVTQAEPIPHEERLEKAAGIGTADLVCHRDTWAFVVERAAADPHFRVPGEVAAGEEGEARVTLSGRTLIAVLTALHTVMRDGREADPGNWALASKLYQRIAEVVDTVRPYSPEWGDVEAARTVIVIDDRPAQR